MNADSGSISAFAEAARRFCGMLEQALNADELALAMADLAAAAERLPNVDPGPGDDDDDNDDDDNDDDDGGDGDNDDGDGDGEASGSVASEMQLSSLPFDLYWMMFDPLEVDREEPVAGSFADDLLDIRRDLLRGLRLLDAGCTRAACWEWRFHYRAHWGAHLMNAQVALLAYRFR